MQPYRWVVSIVTCIAASVCWAQVEQTPIATLINREKIRTAVLPSNIDDFARTVRPSSDQQEAAKVLVSNARDAVNREVNRHLRQIRTGVESAEAGDASAKEMILRIVAIERAMIDDLRAVVTPEQSEGFERFLKARRRTALLSGIGQGVIDIDKTLREMKVDPSRDAQLAQVIMNAEGPIDVALIEALKGQQDYFDVVRNDYGNQRRQEAARGRMIRGDLALQQAGITVVRRVTPLLSEKEQDELVLRRAQAYFNWFSTVFNQSLSSEIVPVPVREILRVDVSPEQRTSMNTRVERFREEYLAKVKSWMKQRDDLVMKGENTNDVNNAFLSERDTLREAVETDLLAMLTPEQRRTYDASPLLEFDSAWGVDEEPVENQQDGATDR